MRIAVYVSDNFAQTPSGLEAGEDLVGGYRPKTSRLRPSISAVSRLSPHVSGGGFAGFYVSLPPFWSTEHATNTNLVKAVVCSGLYPSVAVIEPTLIPGGQAVVQKPLLNSCELLLMRYYQQEIRVSSLLVVKCSCTRPV
jgi:hypothetical protein